MQRFNTTYTPRLLHLSCQSLKTQAPTQARAQPLSFDYLHSVEALGASLHPLIPLQSLRKIRLRQHLKPRLLQHRF